MKTELESTRTELESTKQELTENNQRLKALESIVEMMKAHLPQTVIDKTVLRGNKDSNKNATDNVDNNNNEEQSDDDGEEFLGEKGNGQAHMEEVD